MQNRLFITLVLSLLFCGCQKAPQDIVETGINRLSVGFMGGSDTVIVKSSAGGWTVMDVADWLTVEKLGDTAIRVVSTPNLSVTERSSSVELRLGKATRELFVIQSAVPGGALEHTLDSLALIAIYDACGGDEWYYMQGENHNPWPLEKPIGTWHGVGTTYIAGQTRVSSLDLTALGLTGSVPDELKNLTALHNLSLSGGDLRGNPMGILSQLPLLQLLDLSYNFTLDVSSTLQIGSLGSLLSLNLSGIDLKGSYPTYLGSMTNLISLSMAGCSLGGDIDHAIRGMKALVHLNLSDNNMQGVFPQWIGELTHLQELDLSLDSLSGSIPAGIGELRQLRELKLGYNVIAGALPSSIGQLVDMETLNLAGNSITSIPQQIGLCRKLQYLDISANQIKALPFSIGDLSQLEQFYGSACKITTIPESIYGIKTLQIIDLSNNQLDGELSPLWGGMTNLTMLILNNNNIVKNIPAEIIRAPKLEKLVVNMNKMSGTIPGAVVDDIRFGGVWNSEFYICPQQVGYGFANCDYNNNSDWNDENSGGYIGRR